MSQIRATIYYVPRDMPEASMIRRRKKFRARNGYTLTPLLTLVQAQVLARIRGAGAIPTVFMAREVRTTKALMRKKLIKVVIRGGCARFEFNTRVTKAELFRMVHGPKAKKSTHLARGLR